MSKEETASDADDSLPWNRRRFLAATGATTLSLSMFDSKSLGGVPPDEKINIGMIGCGKRSNWIANLFVQHGGYNISAAMDYFPEQANVLGDKFGVNPSRRFSGLDGYKRMVELKDLDAVVVQSPPYFHPEHAAAAVDAGKHVFIAKPIAVDVPGCLSVGKTGKRATEKNLVFLVDFQTRPNGAYQEAIKRVQGGHIGKIVSLESTYHCGSTWGHMDQFLRGKPNDPEARLRAWGLNRVLSGDIITEQNIHVLDVATWFLDAAPLHAYGTGGSKRDFAGDCWDHFAVIYYFPQDVVVNFNSKQVGIGHDDLLCRIYGTAGTAETHYAGKIIVRSEKGNFDGDSGKLYTTGAAANIAQFYDNVKNRLFSNPTVAPSVRTNLTTILGRMAAYQRREVAWDDMMRENEKFNFDVKGLKV